MTMITQEVHARIQRGKGVRTTLKNHKHIGFLSNTGPNPLNNHKTAKPDSMYRAVIHDGVSLAGQ